VTVNTALTPYDNVGREWFIYSVCASGWMLFSSVSTSGSSDAVHGSSRPGMIIKIGSCRLHHVPDLTVRHHSGIQVDVALCRCRCRIAVRIEKGFVRRVRPGDQSAVRPRMIAGRIQGRMIGALGLNPDRKSFSYDPNHPKSYMLTMITGKCKWLCWAEIPFDPVIRIGYGN
jgi:hypothetical protein